MDIVGILSIVGSIASIVGLFIQAPNWRIRVLHALYGGLAAVLAGCVIYYMSELARVRDIEKQASRLLDSLSPDYVGNAGTCRGQALTGLAFLEKNRFRFPDTYALAKEMTEKSGITDPAAEYPASLIQEKALCQCAAGLYNLVRGIAGGAATSSR